MYLQGYKIRLYPNAVQERMLWQHFGANRFVWNYMLTKQNKLASENKQALSAYDMGKLLTELKKSGKYYWLNQVSSSSMQHTCLQLSSCLFKYNENKSGQPKFKTKKMSKQSYLLHGSEVLFKPDNTVQIPKIGKIKYKTDFVFDSQNTKVIRKTNVMYEFGKYYLSFFVECENQAVDTTCDRMGIDLGVKELAVVAVENKQYVYHNINKSKQIRDIQQKIKHVQRNISRKYKASKEKYGKYVRSNNIIREEDKLAKLCKKLSDIRNNYNHQITAELVKMKPYRVVMEDLDVRKLSSYKEIGKYIVEERFSDFVRKMKYKCEKNGIEFVQADRYFPSSKTCSNCGFVNRNLTLSDRIFKCPECGNIIDRDYNAALNLMKYADLF